MSGEDAQVFNREDPCGLKADYLLKLPSKGLKHSNVLGVFSWRRRWVTLRGSKHNARLCWAESEHSSCSKQLGQLFLGTNVNVLASTSSSVEFIVRTTIEMNGSEQDGLVKESRFRAGTNKERDEWIMQIWKVSGHTRLSAPPPNFSIKGNHYERMNRLGRGSFGVVYKARTIDGSEYCAIKCINCKYILSRGIPLRVIEREIGNLMLMKHPHIVDLYSHFLEGQVVHIVMKYWDGGDLNHRIECLGHYSIADAKQVALELFDALEYCHSKEIVHRDIKPSNIVLKHSYCNHDIVLIDFGLSKVISEGACVKTSSLHTPVGTKKFAAPEIFDSKAFGYQDGAYLQKVDVWSAGAVVFNMLEGMTIEEARQQGPIKKTSFVSQIDVNNVLSTVHQPSQAFLHAALVCDPSKRLTAAGMLSQPWLIEASNQKVIVPEADCKENLSQLEFEDGWKGHSPPQTPGILERAIL